MNVIFTVFETQHIYNLVDTMQVNIVGIEKGGLDFRIDQNMFFIFSPIPKGFDIFGCKKVLNNKYIKICLLF